MNRKKSPLLTTSSNTHSNDIIGKPSCFTESMPKDPKDAQKVFPGFKCWISVSHVPLLPQQQSCTVFLKEMCVLCSADQVLSTRTHFTTNLKTVTITLFWLLHKGRLQRKIFTNVWGTAVTFPSQVLRALTEGSIETQCYCNTSTVVKPPFHHFGSQKVQLPLGSSS